jgi:hypothetical protein
MVNRRGAGAALKPMAPSGVWIVPTAFRHMESQPVGGPTPVGSGLGARALRIETAAFLQLGESTGQVRRHGFETRWHGKLCEIRVLGSPPILRVKVW